jgi:hypothetical protein
MFRMAKHNNILKFVVFTTTCFCRNVRPSSGGFYSFKKGKVNLISYTSINFKDSFFLRRALSDTQHLIERIAAAYPDFN